MATSTGEKISVRIVTPERVVLEETADSLVATAYDGQFGILPGHAPMMVVLGIGEFRVQRGGRHEWFALGGGFLHVVDDTVTVLTPFAEAAHEVDVEAARRLEITAAENPLLQATLLGDAQRKHLARIREQVAARPSSPQ